MHTDLSKFTTGDYNPGPKWKVAFWFFINYLIFNSSIPLPYKIKAKILRMFGANVGKGLVIKNRVRIKYPWKLSIGENCWIGEDVWIDNLANVCIGNNVCLSQGALLLTGNHDYTIISFPYRLGSINLKDGVWIGAKSIVCPGVVCKHHSILTVNSVATRDLEEMNIYAGNPAIKVRQRRIVAV